MLVLPYALAAFGLSAAANARPAWLAARDSALETPSVDPFLVARADNASGNDGLISKFDKSIVADFPIHSSCNASNKMQIERGLFDLKRMLRASIDHLLLYGNKSELFVTYFGKEANTATPLGVYERILSGDKSHNLIRCDDPDHNCKIDGYAGHWRGNNATGETVICDLSYQTRLGIEKFCSGGFEMATGKLNTFWATDLLHRALHLPSLTDGQVVHEADGLYESIELAKNDSETSVLNQASLQAFAYEVFARTNIVPGGCRGTPVPTPAAEGHEAKPAKDAKPAHDDKHDDKHAGHDHAHEDKHDHAHDDSHGAHAGHDHDHDHDHAGHDHSHESASASASAPAAAAPSAAKDCHTHADGTTHCV